LPALLRQVQVVRDRSSITDFKLESVAPEATLVGQGGITAGTGGDLAGAMLGCSDDNNSQFLVPGAHVHDRASGLDVEITAVEPAGTSGRNWPGVRCGLRIVDPAAPELFLEVPVKQVPAFNQLAGIVRDGSSVFLLLQFNGYARETGGRGNLVLAGDLCSHSVAWRSRDMVSNAPAMLLGEYLVTGYGFTREADWLYVLDRRTGHEVQRLRLPKAPEELRLSHGRLFVKIYDGYATFAVAGGSAAGPAR
jgi:hypothetical protein